MKPPVCLITGGSSGIGLSTALELTKQGYHVLIACRSERKAYQAIDYIENRTNQGKVEFLPLNLASLDSIRCCVDIFEKRQLPLNLLINNAGIFNQSGTIRVPAPLLTKFSTFSSEVIVACLPVFSTKATAAATFGFIEPAAK